MLQLGCKVMESWGTVVVAKVEVPVTDKVPERVRLVNEGEATTAMVGLEEVVMVMLEPAWVFQRVK